MTRHDVAVLSLRLLALYVCLQTGLRFSNLAHMLAGGQDRPLQGSQEILGWLFSILLLVGFGCALFFLAPAIARRIFPGRESISSASRPEIGTLALKICGLIVIASFLEELRFVPMYLQFSAEVYGWDTGDARLITIGLTGVAGVVLYFAAPRLSHWLFGEPSTPMDATLLAHVQAVAFSVVGVWLVAISLPPIAQYVGERIVTGDLGPERGTWAHAAVAFLGMLLILGGRGISALWHWMRRAGLSPRAQGPS
jgi:hypothetical protein